MHKAWRSVEKVPYCFTSSSIKLQGHMDIKIDDMNPIRSYQIPQICLDYITYLLREKCQGGLPLNMKPITGESKVCSVCPANRAPRLDFD